MGLLFLCFLVVYIRCWGLVVLEYHNTTHCDNGPVIGRYGALDRCIPFESGTDMKGYKLTQKDMDTGVSELCDDLNCSQNCKEVDEFKIFRCSNDFLSPATGSSFTNVIEDPFPWMKAFTDMCNQHYPGKCATGMVYSQPDCLGEILGISIQPTEECKNECKSFDGFSTKVICD